MADGEVEVAVRAEGVDEAAAEMGGDGDGGGAAGGGRGGDGGLSTAIRGGIVGGLLSSALDPLLEVLDPFLQILQAFVAPLAVLLLRLFSPVLRLLIGLLPAYLDKFEEFETIIGSVLVALFPLAAFLPSIVDFVSSLPGKLDTLKREVTNAITSLPRDIASALFGGGGAGGTNGPRTAGGSPSFPGGASPSAGESDPADRAGVPEFLQPLVRIGGGLAPFVSQITADENIDLSR